MKQIMNIAILVALCCLGFWQWRKKTDEERVERAMEYQRMMEKKDAEEKQRAEMTTFANGMRQHCADRSKTAERNVTSLRKDAAQLAEIVSMCMEEKDSQGKDLKYEDKVLHILKHADVNALALKYLGADFSGITAEFSERIRDVRDAEEKYTAAVKSVEAAYSENMKRAGTWAKMSAQQRDEEIARINREIKRLEARRDKEQKEYRTISKLLIKGDEHTERERVAQKNVVLSKLTDTESEIRKKRFQLDYLRNPERMSKIEANAVSETQARQFRASSDRESAMRDVDRRLKPKKSLVETVAEFESKSVGRLRSTMADKITEGEKNVKVLADKLAAAEEFLLAVPVTDLQELMRRKAKLEKQQ